MTRTLPHNRIVVGVDGSAAAEAAVKWALREARLRRATLHLVCACYNDDRQRAPYAPWSRRTYPDRSYATATAVLAAAAKGASRQLPPERVITDLAIQAPVRLLLDRAADAEMLVLGSSKPAAEPGQPAPALGPVARTCLRLALCPVVIVTSGNEVTRPAAAMTHAPAARAAS